MNPQSEVLLRQYDYLSGRVLLINAPTDQLLAELGDSIQTSVWTWNFNDYQYFQNRQAQVHFGAELPVGNLIRLLFLCRNLRNCSIT